MAGSLRELLRAFDAGLLCGEDCATVADALAATEKACSGARALAAARAVACGAHRSRGFEDGAAWVARQGGTTTHGAREALETASALEGRVREALLGGEISLAQAGEVTKTEKETPGTADRLVEVARRSDLSKLRDQARDERHARRRPEDLHAEQHKARRLRHWRDALGMVRLDGALPPEVGVAFANRIDLLAHRLRRSAKQEGAQPEPFEAYAADALVALSRRQTDGSSTTSKPGRDPAELVIVCDLRAWRRGCSEEGEPCHVIDGGPVPVSVAKQLGEDAFVKAVLHDGVEIKTVRHFGRHLSAALRTALDLGPVPAFTGRRCVDCGRRYGLQYDHVDPVAHQGPTAYDNLTPRCFGCHQAKTERDRRAGLLGPIPARVTRRRRSHDPP